MRGSRPVGFLVAVVLVLGAAGCAGEPPPSGPGAAPSAGLTELTRLAARRIVLSDTVAAAKFGTASPIEDPAREEQVVAAAARGATDPASTSRFFRDQIEASKVVQRGLFRVWTASPQQRPARRADLAAVRPELDRLGSQLVEQLRATAPERAGDGCPAALSAGSAGTAATLDVLHRDALAVALRSVCGG